MSQDTRDRIIKQSIECMAQNINAGLDEIAAAAGVGRATLYRYFSSRADLLNAIKLAAGEELQTVIRPILESRLPARDKLIDIVTRLVPLGASLNVSAYFDLSSREKDPQVKASYLRHLAQARTLAQALKDEGAVSPEIPLVWLVASLDSLIFCAWEKVESGDIAPKQAPWLLLRTFLAGHGTRESLTWLNKKEELNQ
jgi:TetR/AcrR family transcriptional regulator, repressor for lfrA